MKESLRSITYLKSGPNLNSYLGANLVDFNKYTMNENQKYIATEAPFDVSDYYCMIIDTKAKILVSLTTDEDAKSDSDFALIRGQNKPVDLHHLKPGSTLKFDDFIVELIEEEDLSDTLIIKYIRIINGPFSYLINHIIYKNWFDGEFAAHPDNIINIIKAIDHSQETTGSTNQNPIVVNCGYGYGRTAVLILADQIKNMLRNYTNKVESIDEIAVALELTPMIWSIQNEIAKGALTGLRNKNINVFKDHIIEIIKYELIKNNIKLNKINIT